MMTTMIADAAILLYVSFLYFLFLFHPPSNASAGGKTGLLGYTLRLVLYLLHQLFCKFFKSYDTDLWPWYGVRMCSLPHASTVEAFIVPSSHKASIAFWAFEAK